MDASRARGCRGGEYDNPEVLLEIVRLRAERAALLGFATHAAYVTADETAGHAGGGARAARASSPRPPPATPRAEQATCRRHRASEPSRSPLEAHDWAFYTEKVRQAEVRRRHRGAAPLVRGRARAAGRRLLRRRRSSTA